MTRLSEHKGVPWVGLLWWWGGIFGSLFHTLGEHADAPSSWCFVCKADDNHDRGKHVGRTSYPLCPQCKQGRLMFRAIQDYKPKRKNGSR